MKRKIFLAILLFSTLISSCLIKSFNPFFHKDDVVFEHGLLGNWVDQDSSFWTFTENPVSKNIFKNNNDYPHYILNYNENGGKTSQFLTTLFKLDDDLYLDFFPNLDIISEYELLAVHTLPVHSLAKIEFEPSGDILIRWFNEEWIVELIQQQKTRIKHELIKYDSEEGTLVLTATTDELQEFIRKFGNDPNAFDCEDKFAGDAFCRQLTKI